MRKIFIILGIFIAYGCNSQTIKFGGNLLSFNDVLKYTGKTPLQKFSEKFNNLTSPTSKVLFASTYYYRHVVIDCGNNYCVAFRLYKHTDYVPGYAYVPQFGSYNLCKLIGANLLTDVTANGSWSSGSGTSYLLGYYAYTSTSGRYMECTTSDSVTEVGCIDIGPSLDAAIAVVTIDGDNTLANLLPTVNDLITNGIVANTVLITNGGELVGTEKIYYAHDAGDNRITNSLFESSESVGKVRFADNLTPGIHTVRITNTGYIPIGGTSNRIRLQGFYHIGGSHNINEYLNGAIIVNAIPDPLGITEANDNFAFYYKPTGATTDEWLGHDASRTMIDAKIYVDGVERNPSNGMDYWIGDNVRLVVHGTCRHTYTGDVDVFNYTDSVNFNSLTWVNVVTKFYWHVAGIVNYGFCPEMLSDGIMDKGSLFGISEDYDLSLNDGHSTAYEYSPAGYVWDPDGNWAILCEVPADEKTIPKQIKFWDMDTRADNKMYMLQYTSNTPILGNEQFQVSTNYKFGYFDNANLELSK